MYAQGGKSVSHIYPVLPGLAHADYTSGTDFKAGSLCSFYAIDLDHTGQICSEELYKACEENNIPISKSEINNIIQNLNICYNRASNKNVLDYQQFLMAVYDIEKNIDRNKIEKAFEFFDINQDGFIDIDDLKNFYLRSGLKLLNKDEDIREIIKEITNNDKKINLNHFLQLFNFL